MRRDAVLVAVEHFSRHEIYEHDTVNMDEHNEVQQDCKLCELNE